MKLVLTMAALLVTAGSAAAATACPTLTYGFAYTSPESAQTGLQLPACRPLGADLGADPACRCPETLQQATTTPCRGNQAVVSTQFPASVILVRVPQVAGPNGKCVPEWTAQRSGFPQADGVRQVRPAPAALAPPTHITEAPLLLPAHVVPPPRMAPPAPPSRPGRP